MSRDRSIIVWDLRTEKQVSHHSQRMGGVNGVALTKDESMVREDLSDYTWSTGSIILSVPVIRVH